MMEIPTDYLFSSLFQAGKVFYFTNKQLPNTKELHNYIMVTIYQLGQNKILTDHGKIKELFKESQITIIIFTSQIGILFAHL